MNSPLKWHGGKHYLAKQLIAMMPDQSTYTHYIEPYAGSLAVLFARNPIGSEIVNDLHGALTNFWRVLQSEEQAGCLIRILECMPFSEAEYLMTKGKHLLIGDGTSDVRFAADFFVACRQSMSGRMKNFAPVYPNRLRRGMHEGVSAWLTAVAGLPEVHQRLRRVAVYNRDALDIIRQHDTPHTLFYLDPPYHIDTRVTPDVYAHEMTPTQHIALLSVLTTLKGRFLLSGYACAVYDSCAADCGWKRTEIDVPNRSGDSSNRAIECVWRNY